MCRQHGIGISASKSKRTFVYQDRARNFILGSGALGQLHNKTDTHRLGFENSEDALTWNVFVALLAIDRLTAAISALARVDVETHPAELYLWGYRIAPGLTPSMWPKLNAVRAEIEPNLRIPTEPDVILRVPHRALIVLEAKFGSTNSGLKETAVAPFVSRYAARQGALDPLKRSWILEQQPSDVLGQLCRNVMFADRLAEPDEDPIVVNLVKDGSDESVESNMARHLCDEWTTRFRRVTWESLFDCVELADSRARPLRNYLQGKTLSLGRAFPQLVP